MSVVAIETTFLIHSLETLQREIEKEGSEQLVTLAKFIAKHDIPKIIEKLRRLEVLENGKGNTGTTKNTVTTTNKLHEPRHQAMQLRTIPD